MLQTFQATLSPMLIMFTCILIGFILRKLRCVPDNTGAVLSKLQAYIFGPALTLSTFIKNCTVETITQNSQLILFGAAIVGAELLLAYPLSKLFYREGYTRNVYKYALVFANWGFMGNAIVPMIFGQEALFSYMVFNIPLSVATYAWGIPQLIPGEGKSGLLRRIFNPAMFALILGCAIGLLGLGNHMPGFISGTLSNLGGCMGPLAMILTGFVIGGFDLKTMVGDVRVYIATGLRMIVLPGLICTGLILAGAPALWVQLGLVAYGTPLGLNTVVYPAAYGGDTAPGASMAMISHTLSVITLPLMLAVISLFL